jgi:hypothetical protein
MSTILKKFLKNQARTKSLLESFEFSDEAEKVALSIFRAANAYQNSIAYRKLCKRDKITFSFHIISLTQHLHRIQKLQEELRDEN